LAEADSQLEAAHLVLQALCEALEWQLGEFWIIDSEANVLYCLDIWHVPTIEATEFIKLSRYLTFTSGVGLPGSIWQSGETAWIADTRQDKNFPRIIAASKDGLYSATGFPVLIGQQVVGIVELFRTEVSEPDESLRAVLTAIGSQIAQFMRRDQAQQQLQQSEQARQAALQQQQTLAQQAEQARLQAQQSDQARAQAVQQAEEQRQRLLKQLNQVLQTRDSARGLIVSMSDVLFDFNQATLKPGAKLRLAKVSGIILAYPDLKLEIDGFTDNKGTPQYNMTLSDKRAKAVRDFLVGQGVGSDAVNTKGFGESNPVASNATAAGRQQNRRVELVVSGNAIGSSAGASGMATGAAPGSTGGVSGATPANPTSPQPGTATPGSISTPAGTTGPQSRPSNGSSQPPVSNPPATDNKPPNLFQL